MSCGLTRQSAIIGQIQPNFSSGCFRLRIEVRSHCDCIVRLEWWNRAPEIEQNAIRCPLTSCLPIRQYSKGISRSTCLIETPLADRPWSDTSTGSCEILVQGNSCEAKWNRTRKCLKRGTRNAEVPEPACHVNIRLTSTGSSFKFSIYQRKEVTGKEES